MEKIPYLVVVGKKEREAGTVTLRLRGGKSVFGVATAELTEKLAAEVSQRLLTGAYA